MISITVLQKTQRRHPSSSLLKYFDYKLICFYTNGSSNLCQLFASTATMTLSDT